MEEVLSLRHQKVAGERRQWPPIQQGQPQQRPGVRSRVGLGGVARALKAKEMEVPRLGETGLVTGSLGCWAQEFRLYPRALGSHEWPFKNDFIERKSEYQQFPHFK